MLSSLDLSLKPPQCSTCSYTSTGFGFCPDWWPPNPKLAMLAEAPAENEINAREPLVGPSGKVLIRRCVEPLGYTRNDVALCNTLRCRVPGSTFYPTGAMKLAAQTSCRQWDCKQNKDLVEGGLDGWNPTMYFISLHPAVCLRTWNLITILKNDVMKALLLAERTKERVLVLLGDHALHMVLPDCPDGVSRWRGSYGALDWPKLKGVFSGKLSPLHVLASR